MWESQFQLAQQCACKGEFGAHHLCALRGVWAPFLLQLRGFPLLLLPLYQKLNVYVPPSKTKANPNPYWSRGSDPAAPTPGQFPCEAPLAELGLGTAAPGLGEGCKQHLQSTSRTRVPGFASLTPSVLSLQPLGLSAGRSRAFVTVLWACSNAHLWAAQSSQPSQRGLAAPQDRNRESLLDTVLQLFNSGGLPAVHQGAEQTKTYTHTNIGPGRGYR